MKITICGSMQFYQEMKAIKDGLEVLGHEVLVPNEVEDNTVPIEALPDTTDEARISAKIEYDFIREHFLKIQASEVILILNYEKKGIPGYVGGNTFLEMGYAFGLGKKIYLMFPVPKMDYSVEMHSMQPTVIDGDITKIT
jgi:nucleoside 2-deoxyribosyltransferase